MTIWTIMFLVAVIGCPIVVFAIICNVVYSAIGYGWYKRNKQRLLNGETIKGSSLINRIGNVWFEQNKSMLIGF